MPSGEHLQVPNNIKSLSELVEKKGEVAKEQEEEKKQKVDQQMNKIFRYGKWGFLVFIVFLIAYFYLQNKYFGDTIGANSDRRQYEKAMRLFNQSGKVNTEQVKKMYRRLALEFHPDRHPGCEDCAEKFNRYAAAYKLLVDEEAAEESAIPDAFSQEIKTTKYG